MEERAVTQKQAGRAQAERALEHASSIEKELHGLMKSLKKQTDGPVLQRDVESKLAQMRDAFEIIIFLDIHYAHENNVDERMWLKHHQLIEHYRASLQSLQQANMVKKRPVELRKLNSMFVNSIKVAMKFFRLFVQRLASQFDVPELETIVKEFKFEIDPPETRRELNVTEKKLVTKSCYMALIRLGDLSRYRETHSIGDGKKEGKSKNWGPAVGYYNLAKQLDSDLGNTYNQLAVISMAEGSHLSVIYQLYRALSVPEPIEKTTGNLNATFKKILKAYQAGSLKVPNRRDEQAVEDLLLLFIRFHAQCYTGNEPAENESLKSEMLNQLTLAVKDRSVAVGVLNKIVLVNIAAEFHAAKHFQSRAPPSTNYLRLNIETFTSLLLVLQQELERVATEASGEQGTSTGTDTDTGGGGDQARHLSENVTAVARRMLPSLRLYSFWLLVNHPTLTDQLADTSLNVQIKQLWQIYASALSLLAATFPKASLSNVNYILEEDADVLGFLPFKNNTIERTIGLKRLSTSGKENQRGHPNDETLARILFLQVDVERLCDYENVPITSRDGTFAFDDGIISTQTSNMHSSNQYPPITVRDIPKSHFFRGSSSRAANSVSKPERSIPMGSVVSEAVSSTMTTKLNAMVDELVGPNIQPGLRSISTRGSRKSADDDDEEEIVFKGKRGGVPLSQPVAKQVATGGKVEAVAAQARKALQDVPQKRQNPLPPLPGESRITAKDLVNFVTGYTQTLSLSTPNTPRQADVVAAANWDAPQPQKPQYDNGAGYTNFRSTGQLQNLSHSNDRMNMPPPMPPPSYSYQDPPAGQRPAAYQYQGQWSDERYEAAARPQEQHEYYPR